MSERALLLEAHHTTHIQLVHIHPFLDGNEGRGKRYSLPILLLTILLAKLAGEDTPKGIAEWLLRIG